MLLIPNISGTCPGWAIPNSEYIHHYLTPLHLVLLPYHRNFPHMRRLSIALQCFRHPLVPLCRHLKPSRRPLTPLHRHLRLSVFLDAFS